MTAGTSTASLPASVVRISSLPSGVPVSGIRDQQISRWESAIVGVEPHGDAVPTCTISDPAEGTQARLSREHPVERREQVRFQPLLRDQFLQRDEQHGVVGNLTVVMSQQDPSQRIGVTRQRRRRRVVQVTRLEHRRLRVAVGQLVDGAMVGVRTGRPGVDRVPLRLADQPRTVRRDPRLRDRRHHDRARRVRVMDGRVQVPAGAAVIAVVSVAQRWLPFCGGCELLQQGPRRDARLVDR